VTTEDTFNKQAGKIKKITINDLPLSCPKFNEPIIDKHPRIFLALTPEQPQITCPYCSITYSL
jgi:uncharacterized Zn-finger protein